MCYRISTEDLLSFGIPDLNRLLRSEGYSLNSLESMRPGTRDRVEIPSLTWTRTNSWTGEREKAGEVYLCIRKGEEGLCLEIRYSVLREGKVRDKMSLRYDLVKRESNLKRDTFRYYFRDPYSQEETLCSKLYLLPDLGEFVPRSVLQTYGVLYSQQRKGHKERYFYGGKRPPYNIRYRKRHYRGRETPFWRRYRELVEEDNYKWGLLLVGKYWTPKIGSPEIAESLSNEYRRICGRKSLSEERKSRKSAKKRQRNGTRTPPQY